MSAFGGRSCDKFGFPHPEFGEMQGGLHVIFRKDTYTEGYLVEIGLNDRQMKILKYLQTNPRITTGVIQEMFGLSRGGVNIILKPLLDHELIRKEGKGKATHYVLR